MFTVLKIVCLLFLYTVEITDSQDIVGCGGFIKSEVEINFSVIEVCTRMHTAAPVACLSFSAS